MDLFKLFDLSPMFFVSCIVPFSLLIGSFLNVVIHRLPIMLEREWRQQAQEILALGSAAADSQSKEKYNLIAPRSACPKCNAPITAAQNIPLISYLLLRGKCANCGVKISVRYPFVEFGTALLSGLVAWKFGFTFYTAASLLLTWCLIAVSAIDIDHQILPDDMTLPLVWIGLLLSLTNYAGHGYAFPVDPRSAIIGAVAGYLSLWCVFHLFKLLTGKEGMGYGDFKLFAVFGAWLGWQMLPLIILLSAFTGAVIGILLIVVRGRDRNIPIPFGPYLAAAGWIALMWGPEIVGRYLRMVGLSPA